MKGIDMSKLLEELVAESTFAQVITNEKKRMQEINFFIYFHLLINSLYFF